MKNILLGLDMLIACAITLIVLLQRGDSGGALGIGGGGGGLFSARGKANFLTRTTAVLAAMFFAVSLSLAYVSKKDSPTSIIDSIEQTQDQGTQNQQTQDQGTQNQQTQDQGTQVQEQESPTETQEDTPLAQ